MPSGTADMRPTECGLGSPQKVSGPAIHQAPKPVSALQPQMSAVLIWPVFASVARALFSNSLVVGERAQNSLIRPLVHPSRPDRLGTVIAPLKAGA